MSRRKTAALLPADAPLRAVCYVRLSKEDAKGKAEGIDSTRVQAEDGAAAIRVVGWNLVKVITDDDVSGAKKDRPGLLEIQRLAHERRIDVVVVRNLDRLSRLQPVDSMALLSELRGHGVRVWTYPDRKFVGLEGIESVMTFIEAFASSSEREKTRERIRSAHMARVREGRAVKHPPFGYRIETKPETGKRYVIEPDEARTVLRIAETFIEIGSLIGTARTLNERAVRSPSGQPWRGSMVSAILRRPLYRGFYLHAGMRVEHPDLRVFPPDLEKQIDRLLGAPKKPWGTAPKHLSTRFLKCGVCGGSLVVTSSVRSKGKTLVCDRQRSRACEGVGYRSESIVDAALLRAVDEALTGAVWDRVKNIVRQALHEQRKADKSDFDTRALTRELHAAERKVKEATDLVLESSGSEREAYRAALRAETARVEAIKAQLDRAKTSTPASPESIVEQAERRVEELRALLSEGGLAAIPAVQDVLRGERFKVTRKGDRWRLEASISAANLFVVSDKKQKQSVKGQVPETPATPKPV